MDGIKISTLSQTIERSPYLFVESDNAGLFFGK
jgi:hypothetical protein